MKKVFLALAASVWLLGAAAQTATETHFAGERITGVSASIGFEVILVKSNQPKAVVEVSNEIKQFIRVSRDSDGMVSVGIRNLNSSEQKEFNRLRNDGKTRMRLTLYLPTLNTVRLSSNASLRGSDTFNGNDLDIMISSAGTIRGELRVSSERAKVQASSASMIENLILNETTDLTMVLSSSARVAIVAPKLAYSKLGISSAASLDITGAVKSANWSASSSARVAAEEFTVKELNLTASSGANVQTNVVAAGSALDAVVSSSANVTIRAREVGSTKFNVSSGAALRVNGSGEEGNWIASSSARIIAEEFTLKNLTVTSSSGASVRANVSGTLTTRTSGAGSVRYTGNPARVNDLSSSVRPL